ncbi:3-hydroxyacyl-CoA dehydrogenase NAD-binding domain-containing protein [Subtercola sp. YIM 133946]|uniref:3-hydroxyacyl-CoA dehydrogenase NAD-binding domain-containing protein n=1 Tax=Subtercola sp. YIM 133946 TaxID=3118909 RepID=UPI002F944EAA
MTTQSIVASENVAGIVTITLDHAPVNTLGRSLRRALLAALERAEHDDTVTSVVITGTGQFSAGADLAEFDSGEGLAEPTLHLTITGYLDSMSKPTIAAIEGVALGGGLELALACSARVAHPDARLGLPETTLGFMPGAGGTQRLPRAIGIEAALDLIVTGRSVTGSEAAELGLVQRVDERPVEAARALAVELAAVTPRPRLRDQPIAEPLAEAFVDVARRAANRSPRANAGVKAALEALTAAATIPFDDGLALELALFERLAAQPEARAARYRFLSDRAAGRVAAVPDMPSIHSAVVVGAGTMGRGIALALLSAGVPTTVVDTSADALGAATTALTAELDRAVAKGRLSADRRDAQLGLLDTSVSLADAAREVDLVIEAVFENLEVKQGVFRELDGIVRPGTILASNTSSLDLNQLAGVSAHPGDVVGMHFFSPANVMRLVEVVDGAATTPATLAAAVALVKQLRKLPVVAQVGPGFIGNRIFDQYVRQAQLLLREGATPQRIDSALEKWGMAMGPFRVLDLVGNDIPWLARKAQAAATADAPTQIPDPAWQVADELGERGWFGRKSGSGWYRYSTDGSAEPNLAVSELLAPFSAAGAPTDEEIVDRCIFALVVEAAAVLHDGIAASSADVDTVLVNGYGFPATKGGPWFTAELYGFDRVGAAVERWNVETGDPFWNSRLLPATSSENRS